MNQRSPGADAAAAGAYLLASMLLCGGIGFGIGSLMSLAAPLGIAGLFVGFAGGMALVYVRFRQL